MYRNAVEHRRFIVILILDITCVQDTTGVDISDGYVSYRGRHYITEQSYTTYFMSIYLAMYMFCIVRG